ncbi:MAG TPA: AAA family ATPase, partial [Spirochaetota bacterium]|nr:AAA family ATPase [Spirochaetota bacterium]
KLSTLIFYGPPGTGKTTLARIISKKTNSVFLTINAVLAGIKDIRRCIDKARQTMEMEQQRTILFIDEVHRFNKSQQDALLPHVENGTIILIGATTENPFFEVNKALVSRSRIFELKQLGRNDLQKILAFALHNKERGYGKLKIKMEPRAGEHLTSAAAGDARSLLNALELAVLTTPASGGGEIVIDLAAAEESIQKQAVLYDKDGDAHYDIVSAFIKSVRGSDPDAALYWLAKMIYAGEDPRFIFRRMLILAAEDVGMADPHALTLVNAAARAFDYIGMPEGRFHLAEACIYLATAPKSNSTLGFFDALHAVAADTKKEVPDHLKDPARDSSAMGHGRDYKYPHAFREHWTAQQYLPDSLKGSIYYQPGSEGFEDHLRKKIFKQRREQLTAAAGEPAANSDSWLKRTFDNKRETFKNTALKINSLAPVKKDDLVLLVNLDNGFLFWETVKHIQNSGIYTHFKEQKTLAAVQAWLTDPEKKTDPVFLAGDIITALSGLQQQNIKFDKIFFSLQQYNFLNQKITALLKDLTNKKGSICFCGKNMTGNQKIYDILNPFINDKKLRSKLERAENELYSRSDKNVFTDETKITAAWQKKSFKGGKITTVNASYDIILTPVQLNTLVNTAKTTGSYLGRIRHWLDADEIKTVNNAFNMLLNRKIKWKNRLDFYKFTKE